MHLHQCTRMTMGFWPAKASSVLSFVILFVLVFGPLSMIMNSRITLGWLGGYMALCLNSDHPYARQIPPCHHTSPTPENKSYFIIVLNAALEPFVPSPLQRCCVHIPFLCVTAPCGSGFHSQVLSKPCFLEPGSHLLPKEQHKCFSLTQLCTTILQLSLMSSYQSWKR